MRQIELTRGKYAQIDNEDYEYLSQFKWYAEKKKCGRYYARRSIITKGVKKGAWMHREIMGPPREMSIDHINGDGLDNRRENLRTCTHQQNMCNRKSRKDSTSKYLGVSWEKSKKRWRAGIAANGKNKKLGRFKTELEAAIIYNIAARKYFGEFARPNVLA